MNAIDFQVEPGSKKTRIATLWGVSEKAIQWMKNHLPDTVWHGDKSIYCDKGYLHDQILIGIKEDKMTFDFVEKSKNELK